MAALGGAGALLAGCERVGLPAPTEPTQEEIDGLTLKARPAGLTNPLGPGTHTVQAAGRSVLLHVPATYRQDTPVPLGLMLHHLQGNSGMWTQSIMRGLAEEMRFVIAAPSAAGQLWYPDAEAVSLLDQVLVEVFKRVNVDTTRSMIGGFGEGAGVAASIAPPNAGLFRRVLAFSPHYYQPRFRRGFPEFFVSASVRDPVVLYSKVEAIVAGIRSEGSTVAFESYDSTSYSLSVPVLEKAVRWWILH
jgi:hypothetical protein